MNIPDAAIEAAAEALSRELDLLHVEDFGPKFSSKRILAAAMPAIREAIAQEIEAVDPIEWALAGQHAGSDAARIVRGGTP